MFWFVEILTDFEEAVRHSASGPGVASLIITFILREYSRVIYQLDLA